MAWTCTGSTNAELISNLVKKGIFTSARVADAMKKIDRANYTPNTRYAYEDSPQYIGHDATISAPHMHAYAAEALLPYLHPGARVLDVGSGSGYLVSVFHQLVGDRGKVVGIDHIPELVELSVRNIEKDGLGEALKDGKIKIVAGDGRLGYPSGGPYNAIHVGAAAPEIPPALLEQLGCPGRMFIPVGTANQHIWQVDKDEDGTITKTKVMGVRYVPLADRKA